MKIGLVFAMESEYLAYEALTNQVTTNNEIFTYICGIGLVNASSITTKALIEDNLDLIINCGVAGGINQAKQFDVYYANKLTYADVDLRIFDYALGQIPHMPAYYEPQTNNYKFSNAKAAGVLSQASFATPAIQDILNAEFSDYSVIDMESCAIAQTCYLHNKHYFIIRAISDLVYAPNNHQDYLEAEKKAATIAATTLIELLNQI